MKEIIWQFLFSTTGRSFLQWYGTQAQLVIGGPELWKEILNNKERAYPKREPPPYVKKLLGDGLASTEGEKWGKLRKFANHAFHGDILRVSYADLQLLVILANSTKKKHKFKANYIILQYGVVFTRV